MVAVVERTQCGTPVGLVVDLVAGTLEQKTQESPNVLVVIDDQQLRFRSNGIHTQGITRASDLDDSYGIHTCLLPRFLRVRAKTRSGNGEHPRTPAAGENSGSRSKPGTVVYAAGDCPRFAFLRSGSSLDGRRSGNPRRPRRHALSRSSPSGSGIRRRTRRSRGSRPTASTFASTAPVSTWPAATRRSRCAASGRAPAAGPGTHTALPERQVLAARVSWSLPIRPSSS